MRFFPTDDVPGLTAFAEELPKPWVMPRYSRAHRDRLAGMLGRAVERFDPRVRMISLRWVDRVVVKDGRMRLPERALLWWRIEEGSRPNDPIHEAREIPGALHLFDADEDVLPLMLGWLAPLKIQLLHRIADVLLKEEPFTDPNPVLDVLELAAERLVSPIDLLDFAERVIATRAAGLPITDAEAEGYAVVIAGRFVPPPVIHGPSPSPERREAADGFLAALEACSSEDPLSAAARSVLSRHAFVEPAGGDAPLVLEALRAVSPTLSFPGSLEILDRIAWRIDGTRGKPLPVIEPVALHAPTLETLTVDAEAEADFVLASLRARRDRDWTPERRREGALAVRRLAESLTAARGERLTQEVLLREAFLFQSASEQFEAANDRIEAARSANEAWSRWCDAHRAEETLAAAQRATRLAQDLSETAILASAMLGTALANRSILLDGPAEAAATTARDLFRLCRDPIGEGRATLFLSRLYRVHGRREEAFATVNAAQALFREGQDPYREALALDQRANMRADHGADDQVIADLDAGLALANDPRSFHARGWLLRSRSRLHLLRNRFSEATADGLDALRIFEATEDQVNRAFTLRLLSTVQRAAGDTAAASARIDEALTLFSKVKDRLGEASIRIERAFLRLDVNDLDGAAEDIAAIAPVAEESGNLSALADVLFLTARLAQERGELTVALETAKKGERTCAANGNLFTRANAFALQSELLLALGRGEEAHAVAVHARSLANTTHNAWAQHVVNRVLSSRAQEHIAKTAASDHSKRKPRNR
ncbi:MAG: hypothetical protein U0441_24300 [Polyangiaceae bacterium]